jgi:hypothetical protein
MRCSCCTYASEAAQYTVHYALLVCNAYTNLSLCIIVTDSCAICHCNCYLCNVSQQEEEAGFSNTAPMTSEEEKTAAVRQLFNFSAAEQVCFSFSIKSNTINDC